MKTAIVTPLPVSDTELDDEVKKAEAELKALKLEQSRRAAERAKAARDLREKQVEAFAALTPTARKTAIDFFAPKHSRTSCSDDRLNPSRKYHGDTEHVDCPRCTLLESIDGYLDTALEASLTLTYNNG